MQELWKMYGDDDNLIISTLLNIAKRISGKFDIRINWHGGEEIYTDGEDIFIPTKYKRKMEVSQGLVPHEAGHIGYGTFEFGDMTFMNDISKKYDVPLSFVKKLLNVVEDIRVDTINKIKYPGFYQHLVDFTETLMPEIKRRMNSNEDLLLYINLYMEGYEEFQEKPSYKKITDEDWEAVGKIKDFLIRSLTTTASIITVHQLIKILKKYYPKTRMDEMKGLKDFYGELNELMKQIEEAVKEAAKNGKLKKINEKLKKELEKVDVDIDDLESLATDTEVEEKDDEDDEEEEEEGKDKDGKKGGKGGKGNKKGEKGGKDGNGSKGKEGDEDGKEKGKCKIGKEKNDKKENVKGKGGKSDGDNGKGNGVNTDEDAPGKVDKNGKGGLEEPPDILRDRQDEIGIKEGIDGSKMNMDDEKCGTRDADHGGVYGAKGATQEEIDKAWEREKAQRKRIKELKGIMDAMEEAKEITEERVNTTERGDRRRLFDGCKEAGNRHTTDAKIEDEPMRPVGLKVATIRNGYAGFIRRVRSELSDLKNTRGWDHNQKKGRINSKVIRTYASNFGYKRCFSRKIREKTLRILIMVDISGSMGGQKLQSAKTALTILCDALDGIADFRIVLFTGRSNALNILVKDFGEPLDDDKMDKVGRHGTYGANLDGVSIKHEASMLKEGDFIIVISDGQPAGSSYGLEQAVHDIKDVLKQFPIFAFSIDAKGNWLTSMYGNSWIVVSSGDTSELGRKMIRFCRMVAREALR